MHKVNDSSSGIELMREIVLKCRKLLTVREVAFVLNRSQRKIRRMIFFGKLRCTRLLPLRVPVSDVKKYLRRKAA